MRKEKEKEPEVSARKRRRDDFPRKERQRRRRKMPPTDSDRISTALLLHQMATSPPVEALKVVSPQTDTPLTFVKEDPHLGMPPLSLGTLAACSPQSAPHCSMEVVPPFLLDESPSRKSASSSSLRRKSGGKPLTEAQQIRLREAKKNERLRRNRLAAQQSRARKRMYLQSLESRIQNLVQENTHLRLELEAERAFNQEGEGETKGSKGLGTADPKRQESEYFGGYEHVGIHEDMLKDHARTDAYRNSIMQNAAAFKDKVVLDVGCGTGVLSLFCAAAGARRVYAVEATSVANAAVQVVKANHLCNVVQVIHGRVETVDLSEKVDILVSEWMGYCLFYENMLDAVLVARDRFLKPGGHIFPSSATLYLAPFHWERFWMERIEFWRCVYGFDMTALIPLAKRCELHSPVVEGLTSENIMALTPAVVRKIDLLTITSEELHRPFKNEFAMPSILHAPCHGVACWFSVVFDLRCRELTSTTESKTASAPLHDTGSSVVLSTGPDDEETHWGQTLFFFNEPVPLKQDQVISGTIAVQHNGHNKRFVDVNLTWEVPVQDSDVKLFQGSKLFTLK